MIYNLPLLSGLTGSSGVTALAARTASTPQSQQHDGTPQSGNALGSPTRRGARGTRRTEPAEEKQKSKRALAIAFESRLTNEVFLKTYIHILFSKESLHSLDITPSLDMKPKEKKNISVTLSAAFAFLFFPLSLLVWFLSLVNHSFVTEAASRGFSLCTRC